MYTILGILFLLLIKDELFITGELQESSKRAVLNTLKRIDDAEQMSL